MKLHRGFIVHDYDNYVSIKAVGSFVVDGIKYSPHEAPNSQQTGMIRYKCDHKNDYCITSSDLVHGEYYCFSSPMRWTGKVDLPSL